jgi:hypothetical protein
MNTAGAAAHRCGWSLRRKPWPPAQRRSHLSEDRRVLCGLSSFSRNTSTPLPQPEFLVNNAVPHGYNRARKNLDRLLNYFSLPTWPRAPESSCGTHRSL